MRGFCLGVAFLTLTSAVFVFPLRAQQFPTLDGGSSGYPTDNTQVDFARLKNNFTHNDAVKSVPGGAFEVSQPSVRAPTVRSAFHGGPTGEYVVGAGNSSSPNQISVQDSGANPSCSLDQCVEWNSKICVRNGVTHCEAVYAASAEEELELLCKPKCRSRCEKKRLFSFSGKSCQKDCLRHCLQKDASYQKSVRLQGECEAKVQKNQELQQECFYQSRYGCKEGTDSCS